MLGAYPNSTGAAASALEQDDCWKLGAFVLVTSPDSPFAIPTPEPVLARCQTPPVHEAFEMYSGRVTLEWRVCG